VVAVSHTDTDSRTHTHTHTAKHSTAQHSSARHRYLRSKPRWLMASTVAMFDKYMSNSREALVVVSVLSRSHKYPRVGAGSD
jgi:hypothetical protein